MDVTLVMSQENERYCTKGHTVKSRRSNYTTLSRDEVSIFYEAEVLSS
jgi:hypothetical protein